MSDIWRINHADAIYMYTHASTHKNENLGYAITSKCGKIISNTSESHDHTHPYFVHTHIKSKQNTKAGDLSKKKTPKN